MIYQNSSVTYIIEIHAAVPELLYKDGQTDKTKVTDKFCKFLFRTCQKLLARNNQV